MLVLPTGGKGTGVEAEGSNFPFVQPSDDIVGLLADLWLEHEYPVPLPLRVGLLTGFQQAFDNIKQPAGIVILDANGDTVFDSTNAKYYSNPFGPRLWIHEWSFYGIPGSVCRVVQHRAVPEDRPPWPDEITPINGVLDARTSEPMAERLLILSERLNPGIAVTGDILFQNGYNVDITVTPYAESLRNTTMLTFAAAPGGGTGRHPCAQKPSNAILSINGTKPDLQGNFSVGAGQCYFARQPVNIVAGHAVPVDATLWMGNDCGPCCECDDFVAVQKAILKIEAELRATGVLAETTRDDMTAAIERWNQQKECREQQAVTVGAATTASLYADVSIQVCNPTTKCMTELQVDINISTTPGGAWAVVPGTTYIAQGASSTLTPYQLSGPTNGTLTAYLDAVNPMAAGRVRTRLLWSHQMPQGTMLTVKATASTASLGDLFPQSGTFTVLMT